MQGKSINTAGEPRQKGSVWRGEMVWEKRKGKEGRKSAWLQKFACGNAAACSFLLPRIPVPVLAPVGDSPFFLACLRK